MAGRASFIELSRRALAGDEDALISLRTEDADVPDKDLLRRAQNRINRLDQQEARVPSRKTQSSATPAYKDEVSRSVAREFFVKEVQNSGLESGAYIDEFDIDELTVGPEAKRLLRALERDDYLGFDRIDDVFVQLFDEGGLEDFDPSPQLKSAFGRYLNEATGMTDSGISYSDKPKPKAQPSIKAYHGSPYQFDEFDAKKIGTGEGAQAYGYGLYFAEAEDVARGYKEALTNPRIEVGGKPADLIYTADIRERFADLYDEVGDEVSQERLDIILSNMSQANTASDLENVLSSFRPEERRLFEKYVRPRAEFVEPKGAVYEVKIQAGQDELINWDRPVKEQPPRIRDALLKLEGVDENTKGEFAYYRLAPQATGKEAQQQATERAKELGIKGIKYADGFSRKTEGGTSNFVVFDPRIIEISKKYGVSIPLAGALLANTEETQAQNLDDININKIPEFWEPEFFQDDLDPQVLEAREQASTESGAYAQLMADKRAGEAAAETAEADQIATRDLARLGPGGTAVAGLSKLIDLDPVGTVIELPRQILAGSLDALTEAATTLNEMFPLGPEEGFQFEIEAEPRTVLGAGARGISQFMTGFIPALKAVKTLKIAETARKAGKAAGAAGTITEGAIAGALTDAFAFDPDEERLSNLIKDLGIETPVTDYLAASPDDTRAEGRVKNALEGLALGGIADGLMTAFRMYKARKPIQEAAQEQGKSVDELVNEAMQSYKGGADYVEPALRMPEDQEFLPFDEALDVVQPTIRLNAPSGSTLADPEDAQNINLGRLDTTDDVKDLLDSVAIADADTINEARGQKITNAELVDLAEQVGMTPEMLLRRRPREAFTAEEALAARQILVASGENIIRLAKQAEVGGDLELALLRRAMAQHQAIQHQVAGMTAEAGRALQSFRIQAQSTKEQQRAIEDAINDSGGFDINKQLAKRLGQLENSKEVGQVLSQMHGNRWWNASSELFINGILSGAPTHMANVTSNLFVNALTVSERKVASLFGDSIQPGEADAMLVGMVHGIRDGFRLGWQALRTGEPSDKFVKIDTNKYKAIAGEKFGLTGPLGRAVDYIGIAIRTSGRLLTAEDEFFKAVGYRMELHAQAYRTAFNEGLTGDEAAARVAEIINNPPQNIKMASIDAARYGTFTNSVEGMKIRRTKGLREAAERGKAEIPESRVILPFISTPSNIMSFGLERTPISMFSRGVKEELEAGGARRDLALAKIATGSMIMAVSADLALSGSITGGGPANRDMKALLRTTGWQPYSIKVGDKYYAYNRLDPLGMTIGLAADMTEIIGQKDEYDAQQIAVAASLAVAQNLSSKTYLSSFTEFLDAFLSSSDDPDSQNYKLERWLIK